MRRVLHGEFMTYHCMDFDDPRKIPGEKVQVLKTGRRRALKGRDGWSDGG